MLNETFFCDFQTPWCISFEFRDENWGILLVLKLLIFLFQRYNLALEMSPPSRAGELLLNLGSVHHAMGDWELAEQHYTQCLALEPNNQVVIANMKLLSSQLN